MLTSVPIGSSSEPPIFSFAIRQFDFLNGNTIWGEDSIPFTAVNLMSDIKKKLDPNRTLSPGRFVNKI